jgi:dimethylargininase
MFKKAIVRRPCENMVHGITGENLGAPDYNTALKQHDSYIEALKNCGLEVITIEKNNTFPDSVFIEDTAVLTKEFAIITNPSPKARKEEIVGVIPTIKQQYNTIEYIAPPGTLEGGDIMLIGDTFYIGRTARSNDDGIRQFKKIVTKHGYNATTIDVTDMLHLKTGVSFIGNNTLLIVDNLKNHPAFTSFKKIIAEGKEAYAANSLNINDKIILPKGYPETRKKLDQENYEIIELDISEYRKLEGGLSCMSLRF